MIRGDCNTCVHKDKASYSATCVECGIASKNYKPITNADRVRAMSDEELAEWMGGAFFPECPCCPCYGENCEEGWRADCPAALLAWLKQEAKHGE